MKKNKSANIKFTTWLFIFFLQIKDIYLYYANNLK